MIFGTNPGVADSLLTWQDFHIPISKVVKLTVFPRFLLDPLTVNSGAEKLLNRRDYRIIGAVTRAF